MDAKRNIQQVGSKFVVSMMKQGIRQRIICSTREEAQAVRARLELTTAQMHADQWTIGHTLKVVNEQVWARSRNAATANRNGKYAVEFFGKDTLLDAITTVQIDAYTMHLRAGSNKDSTINRKLAALSKLMTYARDRNKMRERPKLARQKENVKTNGRMCFISSPEETEIHRLFGRYGKDCHIDASIVLVDAGLRGSELWTLTAQDVDMAMGTITIWKNKTDAPRVIPMTERVKKIMAIRVEYNPTGQLFPQANNDWFRQQWARVREAMGRSQDEAFIPYALRHTFASRLVQRGARLEDIQYLMGHATIEMTQRYMRLNPKSHVDAIRLLEQ